MIWKKMGSAPKDDILLLAIPTGKVTVGRYDHVINAWFEINGSYGSIIFPSHWMQLPDPPKE